jgi:hypothetical protein
LPFNAAIDALCRAEGPVLLAWLHVAPLQVHVSLEAAPVGRAPPKRTMSPPKVLAAE